MCDETLKRVENLQKFASASLCLSLTHRKDEMGDGEISNKKFRGGNPDGHGNGSPRGGVGRGGGGE